MNTFTYILVFSLLGGVVSLFGGALLLRSKTGAQNLARFATPFAGGALLAAVFLDLIPESLAVSAVGNEPMVFLAVLLGIIAFFLAEGFLQWFHHHHEHDDEQKTKHDSKISLIIFGDTMHNALDGVAIAASFMVSIPVGIVTTIAVAAHEIPQEIGDFGLLLSKGMARKKVLLVNALSALATTLAAVATYWLGSEDKLPIGIMLAVSAGFLLYIALSDVIPTIHHKSGHKKSAFLLQALLLVLGVATVGLANRVAHQYIDVGHNHGQETYFQPHGCIDYYDKDGHEILARDCEDESKNFEHHNDIHHEHKDEHQDEHHE